MSDQVVGVAPRSASPVRRGYVVAAVLALAMMVLAIQYGSDWLLNFLHVMTGALWTGIDLFMGFVGGPVLKRLPLEGRRAVISGLVPRTLFLNGDGQHHLLDHRLVPRQTNGFSRCRLPGVPLGHRGPRHRDDPDYPGHGNPVADESAPLFRAAEAEPGQRQHDDVGVLLDRPRFVLRTNGR